MSKNTNNYAGQPILGQLLSYIPKELFQMSVSKYNSDAAHGTVSTWDQFVFMFYGVLTGSSTLREIRKNFALFGNKLAHCGIKNIPFKSSISDANRLRNPDVFGDLYMRLYQHNKSFFSDSYLSELINGEIEPKTVEVFDSTTVSLFSDVFKNVGRIPHNGQKKGGIKAFTKINLSERVPNFICLKAATTNEKAFLCQLDVPSGTILVFDKGFQNYGQYQRWNERNIHFVTRLNENAKFKIITDIPLTHVSEDGPIKDAHIELRYICDQTKLELKVQARMVAYIDPLTGNQLTFISNLMDVKAQTICLLYKNRWTIEPLFKQLKQNFELTYFLADSAYGIKTQIWIALILNLIFTLLHKMIKEAEDFATMVKLAAKNTSSYVHFIKFLRNPTILTEQLLTNIEIVQISLFEKPRGGGILNSS